MSVFSQFVKIIEKIDHSAEVSFQPGKYEEEPVREDQQIIIRDQLGSNDETLLVVPREQSGIPTDIQTSINTIRDSNLSCEGFPADTSPNSMMSHASGREHERGSISFAQLPYTQLSRQKDYKQDDWNGTGEMKHRSVTNNHERNDQLEGMRIRVSSHHYQLNSTNTNSNTFGGFGLIPPRTIHIPLTLEEIETLLEPLISSDRKESNINDTNKRNNKDTVSSSLVLASSSSQDHRRPTDAPSDSINCCIKALALAMGKSEAQTLTLQRSVDQLERRCATQEEQLIKRNIFLGKLRASWPSIAGGEEHDTVLTASHKEIQESLLEELIVHMDDTYTMTGDDNTNKSLQCFNGDSSQLMIQRLQNLVCTYSETITILEASNAVLRSKLHEDKTMKEIEEMEKKKVSVSALADERILEDLQEEVRRRKVELSSLCTKWVSLQRLFDEKCHEYENLRKEFSNFRENETGYRFTMFAKDGDVNCNGKYDDNDDGHMGDLLMESVPEKGKIETPNDRIVINIPMPPNDKHLPITSKSHKKHQGRSMLYGNSIERTTINSVTNTVIYRAIPENRCWGRSLKLIISYFDTITIKSGQILWRYAIFRCFASMYVVMLHVYVFFVAISTVHSMHISYDVHDHIGHHIRAR